MEVDLQLDGHDGGVLRVWLFRDVADVGALRDKVVAGVIEPEMAFLNAAMIPDLFTLRLAAFAARAAVAAGRARTRSPYTELVVCLSSGKNISAALSTFGLSPATRHVLVARFDPAPGDGAAAAAAVGGTPVPLSELEGLADAAAQAKAYGVEAGEYGALADAAATRIAVRECG